MSNKKQSSKPLARLASKALQSSKSSATTKRLAGSVLSQTRRK